MGTVLKNKDCHNLKCLNVDKDKILQTISSIDSYVYGDTLHLYDRMFWGYGCVLIDKRDLDRMVDKKESLIRYLDQIELTGMSCLCESDVQSIIEDVSFVVGKIEYYKDYIVEKDDGFDEWVKTNPKCVAYEDWERSVVSNCKLPDYKIEVDYRPLTLFSYEISAERENCRLFYDLLVDVKDLSVDYEVQAELLNCEPSGIKFESELIECGFSPQIISELEECGIDVEYSAIEECPVLKYGAEAELKLCDINFEEITTEEICEIKYNI